MKQRLFRGIVLMFLVYTGFEVAFPQFCGEKAVGILGNSSVTFSSERYGSNKASASISAAARRDPQGLPSIPQEDRDTPKDEDCFCCCAHVMPSPVFVDPKASELVLLPSTQPEVSIPTASLRAPYHPPRSA